jgi:hypothetical protein
MKVRRPSFLGIEKDDWSGVFWASVLLMITVAGLCAAVKGERNKEDFCCE